MNDAPRATLGVDPGTRKCGYAVVTGCGARPLAIGIEPTTGIIERIRSLLPTYPRAVVARGRGTRAAALAERLTAAGIAYAFVDEHETTLRARKRYFADNPPRGWRRLVPIGMLMPPRPIDDYAAVLIAERYLQPPP